MHSVREALASDAPAIASIYNEGIATFETGSRTVPDVESWFESGRYPIVVVEDSDGVIAWAAAHRHSPRACCDGIVEVSVYVARRARSRGAGRAALEKLLCRCDRQGFSKALSRVFTDNVRSRALRRSLGFREVGVYLRHARLDGAWKDCVIVERLLGDAAS